MTNCNDVSVTVNRSQLKSTTNPQQLSVTVASVTDNHAASVTSPRHTSGGLYTLPDDGAKRPLVLTTELASPPPSQPQQPHKRLNSTAYKFYLQSLARDLLGGRVGWCLRRRQAGGRTVDLVKSAAGGVRYKNLITCGRLWQCPVCAAKITERRADELRQGVTRWHEGGGFVALLTFTLRHNEHDRLTDLEKALRNAYRRFKSGAPFQRLAERFNWRGSVTALEVTYGANGWHPHLHVLAFFEPVAASTWRSFEAAAKTRWLSVLAAEGATATYEHGLDIRDADSEVYEYLSKWGKLPTGTGWTLDREVAKSPVKQGHADGLTPWQLLEAYGAGDERAGRLFQEYNAAFRGKAQLVWSRGLRAELGLTEDEPTDEALAAEDVTAEDVILASFTTEQWFDVLQVDRQRRGFRGELLEAARLGTEALRVLLDSHGLKVTLKE